MKKPGGRRSEGRSVPRPTAPKELPESHPKWSLSTSLVLFFSCYKITTNFADYQIFQPLFLLKKAENPSPSISPHFRCNKAPPRAPKSGSWCIWCPMFSNSPRCSECYSCPRLFRCYSCPRFSSSPGSNPPATVSGASPPDITRPTPPPRRASPITSAAPPPIAALPHSKSPTLSHRPSPLPHRPSLLPPRHPPPLQRCALKGQ